MHDARVLRRTDFGRKLQENPDELFYNNMHLLGDSAYPLSNNLMTPFRDNGQLTVRQKRMNRKLSSNRICIEHTFGLLKTRFRILKFVNVYNTIDIPKIILGCCILHNLCIVVNDSLEEHDIPELEGEVDIMDFCHEQDERGVLKRNYLCSVL